MAHAPLRSHRILAPPSRERSLVLAAVATAFVAGVGLTWHRLGSLFIDCGRELEVPRRILEGDALYRDVRYYWGPLAPYLNAGLYGAFGVSLDTVRWAGIATAALACAGVYWLAREFLGRLGAASVAIAFLHLCAFAQLGDVPIFNFILPFNCSATYGITAALWSVQLMIRHRRSGGSAALACSVALLLVTLTAKAEVAFATAAAHAAFAAANARRLGRVHAFAYASVALLAVATYGILLLHVGETLWRDNLAALGNPASRHYVALTMGVSDVRGAARNIAASGATLGALLLACVAVERFTPWTRLSRLRSAVAVVATFVAAFGVACVVPLASSLACLPLLMIAAIAAVVVARSRRGAGALEGRWSDHLALWVFSLACLVRIPLRADPIHYGFYLLPPALVCVAVLFFDYARRVAAAPLAPRVSYAVGAGLFAGLVVAAVRLTVPNVALASVSAPTPRGHMRFPGDVPEPILISFLSRLRGVRSAIAVPQGVGVLFASGLPNGRDGMTSYLPMELPDEEAEARLVARWEAEPPDLVLYWNQDMRQDFGYAGFGIDYGVRARRWLVDHYVALTDPGEAVFVFVRAGEGRITLE